MKKIIRKQHRNDGTAKKAAENMIWIKMINYKIIHSSFMLWCSWSHELFPSFSRNINSLAKQFFFVFINYYESGKLFNFKHRVSLMLKVSFSNNNLVFLPAIRLSTSDLERKVYAITLYSIVKHTVHFHVKYCIDFI